MTETMRRLGRVYASKVREAHGQRRTAGMVDVAT